MTAYAQAEKKQDDLTVSVEIRSYNSRHLDVAPKIPHGYNGFEEKMKSVVASRLTRGRIEIRLQLKDESEAAVSYEIDDKKARSFYRALLELKETFGLADPVSLDHIMSVSGIIKPADMEKDLESQWEVVSECLNQALDRLVEMRKVEGGNLYDDFAERLIAIEKHLAYVEKSVSDLVPAYRERLEERIAALTKGITEIDPERIAQEAAFLADKSDISEEIVRAKSHIDQFRSIMDSQEPGGRKLNFLLQEFNREFNTMGSKVGKADVAHIIVTVKSELEKLREQVQNVE